jgi:hypothetical protein
MGPSCRQNRQLGWVQGEMERGLGRPPASGPTADRTFYILFFHFVIFISLFYYFFSYQILGFTMVYNLKI